MFQTSQLEKKSLTNQITTNGSQMKVNRTRYLDSISTTSIALGQCVEGGLQTIVGEIPIG